jgi:hypothetical protein
VDILPRQFSLTPLHRPQLDRPHRQRLNSLHLYAEATTKIRIEVGVFPDLLQELNKATSDRS